MNTRRYTAATSRAAMQQVRRELGADAVILSNRQTAAGVEIVALTHQDMSRLLGEPAAAVAPRPPAPARAAQHAPDRAVRADPGEVVALTDLIRRSTGSNAGRSAAPARAAAAPQPLRAASTATAHASTRLGPAAQRPIAQHSAEGLLREIRSVQGMLREQIAALAWGENARKRPLRALLLRELLGAGFSTELGRSIVDRLPDDFSESQARKWLAGVLAHNLRCVTDDQIVNRGGIVALVGPTGVGKTTTVAKLAARFVMKHGAQHLGLITTDNYRIGAQEQLRAYGKMLGVPVFVAQDVLDMRHAVNGLSGKRLILIDTIGMGQRDARVADQHRFLAEARVQRLLLLNAASQAEMLHEVIAVYRGSNTGPGALAGTILTKLDEAVSIGGVLDAVVRNKLDVRYLTTGQRVPEDLALPDARALIHRSLKSTGRGQLQLSATELSVLLAPGRTPLRASHA